MMCGSVVVDVPLVRSESTNPSNGNQGDPLWLQNTREVDEVNRDHLPQKASRESINFEPFSETVV